MLLQQVARLIQVVEFTETLSIGYAFGLLLSVIYFDAVIYHRGIG